ncbi:MAG: DinB family protein [Thermoanaerobaculia bacterium]
MNEPPERLSPQLQGLRRSFTSIKRQASSLTEALSEAQLSWRPGPGHWSILDCFEHLNLTTEHYLGEIHRAYALCRRKGLRGEGSFRLGFLEKRMISLLEPPVRRRFTAPRTLQPIDEPRAAAVVQTFMEHQDRFIDYLERGGSLPLGGIKVASPVSRLLRFRVGSAFVIVTAHERRHLWQGRQVKQHDDFPP